MRHRIFVILGIFLTMYVANGFAQNGESIEQRVALIIGNATYRDSPLKNPANDATDMAATLEGLGFQVILRVNSNRRQMVEAVREFGNAIKRGGVGFFYYSGHGIQSRGKNFLVPVDARIEGEADLEFETVDANMVLAQMDEAANRVNIVVLDACRDNPFSRSFRSSSRGLAQMDSAKGSFLAYATSPGSVASDGEGRNGTYTKHLLSSLLQPDTKLEEVFKRVRVEVANETGNRQIPWDSSSVLGDFYFRMPQRSATTAVTSNPPAAVDVYANERVFWESVKDSRNPEELNSYIAQYPNGTYAGLARARLKIMQASIEAKTVPTPQSPPPPTNLNVPAATVYIMRKGGFFPSGHVILIYDGDQEIGSLPDGSYLTRKVPAGEDTVYAMPYVYGNVPKVANTMIFESGKNYYFYIEEHWGFNQGVTWEPVEEREAKLAIGDLKPRVSRTATPQSTERTSVTEEQRPSK
jgi:hypothetical protein